MAIEHLAMGSPLEQDPSEWVDEARAGNHSAIAELIRMHHDSLHSWLVPRIDEEWQSLISPADVLQQTYTDIYLGIACFVPNGANAFFLWARRIAENNLRDAVRGLRADKRPESARRLTAGTDENSREFLDRLVGHASTRMGPSRLAARHERDHILRAAIEKLPPDYATIVTRYDLLGHPMQQISADLARSVGACHMIRARAHRRLKELLASNPELFQTTA